MNRYLATALIVTALASSALWAAGVSSRQPTAVQYRAAETAPQATDNGASTPKGNGDECQYKAAAYAFLKRTVSDPISLFTAVLAFVAIFQGAFIVRSSRSAKRSADAAIAAGRAHLFPEVEITKLNIVVVRADGDYRIRFQMMNHGRSPAVITKVEAVAFVADKPPSGVPLANIKGFFDVPVSDDSLTDEIEVPLSMTGEQWASVTKGEKKTSRAFLVAAIGYEDVFGNPHETRFCLRWDARVRKFVIHPNKALNRRT